MCFRPATVYVNSRSQDLPVFPLGSLIVIIPSACCQYVVCTCLRAPTPITAHAMVTMNDQPMANASVACFDSPRNMRGNASPIDSYMTHLGMSLATDASYRINHKM